MRARSRLLCRGSQDRASQRWMGNAALFVILLLACRIVFLLAALDPAEERVKTTLDWARVAPAYGPERPLYDQEELYAGAAAEAIRMGAGLPLSCYRVAPYGSGSLLVPLFAVPLYAAFGPYYLTFKVIPLLVTVLGGLAWFLAVRNWWGRRAAAAFGFLYILAPSMFVRTALISKGDHAEAMAWIGGVLYMATRAATATMVRRHLWWAGAAGLAFGLGFFITYSTVPIPAAIALFLVVRTQARPRSVWRVWAIGLAVGLLPWLGSVLSTRGNILQVYGRPIGAFLSLPEILERARMLVVRGFMADYDLPAGTAIRVAVGIVWLAAVVFGVVCVLRRDRRSVTLAALVGLFAGAGAFCVAAPDTSSRYLVPVYPLLLLSVLGAFLLGGGGTRPRGTRSRVLLGWTPILIVAGLGLVSQLWVVTTSSYPATRAPLKGTYWRIFGEYVGQLASADRILDAPPSLRPTLWVGCGKRTFWQVQQSEWPLVAALAGSDSLRVWEGIGIAWVESGNFMEAARVLPHLNNETRVALRSGIAARSEMAFAQLLVGAPAQIPRLLAAFEPQDRADLERVLLRTRETMRCQSVLPSSDLEIDRALPSTNLAAKGWATYREIDSHGRIRYWRPPAAARNGLRATDDLRRQRGAAEGIADGICWDISTRSQAWVRSQASGPGPMLRQLTADLSETESVPYYRAAGRAMASSAKEPGALPWTASDALSLMGSIADSCRGAFLSGWEQGVKGPLDR